MAAESISLRRWILDHREEIAEISRGTPSSKEGVSVFIRVNECFANFIKQAKESGFELQKGNPIPSFRHHRNKARRLLNLNVSEVLVKAISSNGIYGESGLDTAMKAEGKMIHGRAKGFFNRFIERIHATFEANPPLLDHEITYQDLPQTKEEKEVFITILIRANIIEQVLAREEDKAPAIVAKQISKPERRSSV